MKYVGEKIHQARVMAGLKVSELCKLVDCDDWNIYNLDQRSKLTLPLVLAVKICKALNISISYLCDEIPPSYTFDLTGLPIGQRIQLLRRSQRLSIKKLARLAGLTPVPIFNTECRGGTPRRQTLIQIAKALGMSYEQLVDGLPIAKKRRTLKTDAL